MSVLLVDFIKFAKRRASSSCSSSSSSGGGGGDFRELTPTELTRLVRRHDGDGDSKIDMVITRCKLHPGLEKALVIFSKFPKILKT